MIIFDLDGTLSLTEHRQHYIRKPQGAVRTWKADWPAFFKASVHDEPNMPVIYMYQALATSEFLPDSGWDKIGIFSGRSDIVRSSTEAWLDNHGIYYDLLMMRKEGDFTPDDVLKRNWMLALEEEIVLAVDDRQKVVDMWRHHGITCVQVAPGDF